MKNRSYNIPIGLGFAYLKGSVTLLDKVLVEKKTSQILLQARSQLVEAIDIFNTSIIDYDSTSFLVRYYQELSVPLIEDSYILLSCATAELISEIKMCD